MTVRAVHWHEGMFLRPQHFQQAQQYGLHMAQLGDKWDSHYNWGMRSVEIDTDALANYRLVVRSLRARLREGALISVPEDGLLADVELKPEFEAGATALTVYLGVPVASLGKVNVAANGTAGDGARYLLETLDLEDENTGLNPQPVQVRLPNLKVLLSNQDHAGYEVIPIVRVQKSARAEGTPEIDETYIPPVLACDAWKPLGIGILQEIYDKIGKRIELLAPMVVTRGITFDSQAQGDPLIFAQLRVLNEAYALLGALTFAQGVHPFVAFVELMRMVGQMAIFGKTRRAPDLPRYDHDDLGGCFYRLKQYIEALFYELPEPEYKERPFVGAGLRMQVSLEPAWLESMWGMYVGVQSQLSAEECIKLLTRAGTGGLDMKIGSSQRVDEVFRLGQRGLIFAPSPRPPRALPTKPGLIHFQVNRESQLEEWQNVQKSLTVAIRLNERLIASDIQGQRILTIKTATGQTTTLQFTLYVVPEQAAAKDKP
jgi:type VI secretion system protein ImpJ